MLTGGFGGYLVLYALALSVASIAVRDVWPDVGDGFLSRSLFQTPGSSEIGPNGFLQLWNWIDLQSSFALRLMNSSWSGPAETNVYQKGESVHLQAFGSSAPDQELFIQSCYATCSNPMDKTRSALILNNGCVASKQSAIEFISRRHDSINLLLNTSRLMFSQVFVHCSVVFSSAVTPDTKSCNYNKNNSLWVELSGQTSICECCASKCKGPPSHGGPSNALVRTGPLTIKQAQHAEPSNSSHIESSTGINRTGSRFPSLMEKGWIVASATISDGFKMNVPYSSPWLSQPVASDSVMVINQDPGNALSLWLPGLLLDVSPNPILELVIDVPQQTGTPRLVSVSSQGGAPTEGHAKTLSEEKNLNAHDWQSPIPEDVSEVYMADSPGSRNDWDLEGFHSPEEELRGDVFTNYKLPQQHDLPGKKVQEDPLVSPLLEKPEEKAEEIQVLKQKEKLVKEVGDEFGTLAYMKKMMLTFRQASDGSSSLSYEEEERSPSLGEQKVKKSKLEMDGRKVAVKGSSKEVEKDLMQSLSDVVRSLTMTAQ